MDENITRQEFREETEHIYSRLNKHDKQLAVLETLVENMKELPTALNNLEKTMALMGQNLEILNEKVDSIISQSNENEKLDRKRDNEIARLDNKSKVDILDLLKNNWWKICIVLAAAGILIENVFAL